MRERDEREISSGERQMREKYRAERERYEREISSGEKSP